MFPLHSILQRQLHRFHLDPATFSPELLDFLKAVNESYVNADEDIASVKRSLDISSQEFREIQKKTTEALQKYEKLINNLNIAVIQTDINGNILDANPACITILELPSKEELLKRNIKEFYRNIDDRKKLIDALQSNTKVHNYELSMKTAKDREITVLIDLAIQKRINGTIILDAIVEDITQRKMTEKALQEAHDLLEVRVLERTKELETAKASLVNVLNELMKEKKQIQLEKSKMDTILAGIGDGVWVIDPNGKILLLNTAAEKMLGIKKDEYIFTPITNLCLENQAGHMLSLEERPTFKAMQTKRTISHPLSDPIFIVRKDGTRFPAMMLSTPLFQNNELLGGVAIFRDITQDLEIDRQKNEFISIASHELRTPLTAIDGIISMLLAGEYGELGDEVKKALVDVNVSSERLIELINDLLNLSRMQEGRLIPELTRFKMAVKIQNSIDMLHNAATQKGLELKTDTIDDVEIQADPQKTSEVLDNIIGNAIKFTDTGSIVLSTNKVDEMLHIHIKDTGIGISEEGQKKLFGRFAQITTKSGRPAGTGLGLYISREILRKMGGDLWLVSTQESKGTEFCFSLPLAGTQTAKNVEELLKKQNEERRQD